MKDDLIFYQILSTTCNSLRKCTAISLENFYVDILGIKGREIEVRYFVIWARALGRILVNKLSYQPILCQHVS